MPIGYLITIAVLVAAMLLALLPIRRPGSLGIGGWVLSAVANESPFLALYWLLAASLLAFTQGDLDTPAAWAAFGLGCVSFAAAPVLVRRSLRARAVIDRALADGLGHGWRAVADPAPASQLRRRLPWGRIVFAPLPFFARGVRRLDNLSYGPHGRRNRLDVYHPRGDVRGAPILVHLHGGGFRTGRKSFYARALLHGFARRGWVCVSASYRLRPAGFRDFVIDTKRVIGWAREHAHEYGADPTCILLAGSSAGAHLAVTAALTADDPGFQPGFEDVDTSVTAAIGMYGYYGRIEAGPSSPADYVHRHAPPLLIVHGDQDTYVPPEHARQFVDRRRATSTNPVIYAELPGAQHTFDLFHSIRFEIVVDGIRDFAGWIRSPVRQPPSTARQPSEVA